MTCNCQYFQLEVAVHIMRYLPLKNEEAGVEPSENSRIPRLPQVLDRIGISRSQVYELIKRGQFPKGIKLGVRARGWSEADIHARIRSREEA